MTGSEADRGWAERARWLAERLDALGRKEAPTEGVEPRSEEAAPYLQQADDLLTEIEAAPANALDESERAALRELARASAELRRHCGQDMEQMQDQRLALRQAGRALKGYAATGGTRDGRYLDDQS